MEFYWIKNADEKDSGPMYEQMEMGGNFDADTNLTLKFQNEVTSLFAIFRGNEYLYDAQVIRFPNNKLVNISQMFKNCIRLKKVNLTLLKAEALIDASHLFENCNSLETVILPDIITSSVKDMSYMLSLIHI